MPLSEYRRIRLFTWLLPVWLVGGVAAAFFLGLNEWVPFKVRNPVRFYVILVIAVAVPLYAQAIKARTVKFKKMKSYLARKKFREQRNPVSR